MTVERWRQIEELYHAARERGRAVLADADPELRREVEELLAHDSGSAILDKPAAHLLGESTVTALEPGAQLGPYRIEALLGVGGMGEVFRASDTRLGRAVAIKIAHDNFTARFEREARAVAALNHPNICTLYDIGPNYLVMEMVEGETLATRLKRGALPLDLTLFYGAQIAGALAAVHAKGIVHRDLKPGNIMINKSGVKVLDFGLAKSPEDETLTASRVVMGTPAYMAPEQREGRKCDARTDIYALGLVLHEMATGTRLEQRQMALLDQFPEKLTHVIERCIAPDPDDRWQSARDVNAELTWAGEAPSRAEPEANHRSKFRPWLYSGISLLAGAMIATALRVAVNRNGTSGEGAYLPAAESLLTIASYTGTEKSGALSPDGRSFAFVSNRGGSPDIWVRQVSGGAPVQITHDDIEEQDLVYAPDGDSIYYATASRPPIIQRVGVLGGASRTVATGARFPAPSPDGKYLAYTTISNNTSWGDTIEIADADGGNPRGVRQDGDKIALQYLRWSPDGKWLAYATGTLFSNYTINIIDSQGKSHRILQSFPAGRPYSLEWAADSRSLVYSFDARPLGVNADIWIKPITGGPERRLTLNPRGSFRSVSISRDGKRLLGTVEDLDYEVWRVPVQADPISNAARATRILDAAWQPMWTQLGRTGILLFNSPATGERNLWLMPLDNSNGPRQITFLSGGQISHASLSPDGSQVAFVSVASGNGQIWAGNADGSGLRQLTRDAGAKSWPFWSPDGKWIMFASQSPGNQQLWRVPSGGGKAEQFTQDGGLRGDWSPSGDRIAYDVNDSRVRIAASSGKVLREVKGVNLYSPVWSPDGKRVSAHGRASVWIVDPETGGARLAVQFPDSYRFNYRAAWTPDGKSVVVNKSTSNSRIVLLENF
jgi:Tol biopolymer transport system component